MSGGLTGRRGPGGFEVVGPDDRVVAAVRPNDWETRFFGRRFGLLETEAALLASLPFDAREHAVALAASAADEDGYHLLQAQADVRSLEVAAALEVAGFRLVDTRVEFLTRLDRRLAPRHDPPFGVAGPAGPQDRDALLALVQEGLTTNPAFRSRYKDPAFFTPEETSRWFAAWVDGDLADPKTLSAVWRVEEGPAAFFGYARRGEREGLPLYKSTLAVVARSRQGHKAHIFLQTALFDAMPADEFWVRGATQLTNGPVIRNNIALGRRLDRIELTFFRRGPA
ncbi:MAG: hypothetical protein ABIJ48_12875 [Actinomycetota bacterium]